jgi:glutamine synthetase
MDVLSIPSLLKNTLHKTEKIYCIGGLMEHSRALCARKFLEPIFPKDAIDTWIELKSDEYKQNSIRPTPYEFYQYFDI